MQANYRIHRFACFLSRSLLPHDLVPALLTANTRLNRSPTASAIELVATHLMFKPLNKLAAYMAIFTFFILNCAIGLDNRFSRHYSSPCASVIDLIHWRTPAFLSLRGAGANTLQRRTHLKAWSLIFDTLNNFLHPGHLIHLAIYLFPVKLAALWAAFGYLLS